MKKEPQSSQMGFRRNGTYFSCLKNINNRFYFILLRAPEGPKGTLSEAKSARRGRAYRSRE